MSTKTIYKRIALVAVAALGAGVLSVAPAFAAGTGTVSIGTTTPAIPVAGTAVSTPVTFTFGGTEVASETFILTASLQSYPNGATTTAPTWAAAADAGALTGSSFVAAATTTVAGAVRTSASVATITQATTTPINDAGGLLGNLVFTPSVPGNYMIKITGTGTGTAANAFISINVAGLAATQATSGVGTSISTGQVGGNVTFVYSVPAGSTAGTVYQIAATGGTITTVNGKATAAPSFTTVATDANLASGAVAYTTTTNVTKTNAIDYSAGAIYTGSSTVTSAVYDVDGASAAAPAEQFTVTLTSAIAAGVTTLTINSVTVATGATSTVATGTVTWGAAPAASAQYSLLTLNAGAGTTATGAAADTAATTVARTAGTKQFTIQVVTKDQNSTDINGLTLLASISGPGSLGIATTTASSAALAGRSLSVALTGTNLGHVTVFGDGTSGVATVTITVANALGVATVLGSKSVTFVGSPAKVTVTQNLKVAQAATQLGKTPTTSKVAVTSAATAPAFTASVVDSNGVNVVAGVSTLKITSSDSTVIVAGTCAEYTTTGSSTATVPTPGIFECSVSGANAAVSGKTATITLSVLNSTTGLYDIVAAPITFAIGGSIASTVVAVNKTSYLPGEAITMTATAKDSSGNAAYDGQNPYATVATGNMTVGGAFPATTAFIVGGVHSTTVAGVNSLFAPASAGTLTVTGLTAATATAPTGAAYSASITVTSGTDISAITTLINSLIAKINALNKLVIKIQKKVKA